MKWFKTISENNVMEELTKQERIQIKVKAYELALAVKACYEGEDIDNKANDIYNWLMKD